jgi:hypothetical protein
MTRTNTPDEDRRAAERAASRPVNRSPDPPLDAEQDQIAREREADDAQRDAQDATAASRLVPEDAGPEPHLRGQPHQPDDARAMDALKLTAETSRRT